MPENYFMELVGIAVGGFMLVVILRTIFNKYGISLSRDPGKNLEKILSWAFRDDEMKRRMLIIAVALFVLQIAFLLPCSFAGEEGSNKVSKNVEYFVGQGNSYLEQGRNNQALEAYKKAVSLDEKNYEAHSGLGTVYAKLKDYDNALVEWELAIRLSPQVNEELEYWVVLTYLFKNDPRAIWHFKKVSEMNKKFAVDISNEILFARLYGLKEIEGGGFEAIRPFFKMTESQQSIYDKAEALYVRGDCLLAVDEFKKILNSNASKEVESGINYAIGRIYLHCLEKPEECIVYFKKAAELNPAEEFYPVALIEAYSYAGDNARALDEVDKILQFKPRNKYALYAKGLICSKQNHWQCVIENWDKLKEIDNILFALIEEQYNKAKNTFHQPK